MQMQMQMQMGEYGAEEGDEYGLEEGQYYGHPGMQQDMMSVSSRQHPIMYAEHNAPVSMKEGYLSRTWKCVGTH